MSERARARERSDAYQRAKAQAEELGCESNCAGGMNYAWSMRCNCHVMRRIEDKWRLDAERALREASD